METNKKAQNDHPNKTHITKLEFDSLCRFLLNPPRGPVPAHPKVRVQLGGRVGQHGVLLAKAEADQGFGGVGRQVESRHRDRRDARARAQPVAKRDVVFSRAHQRGRVGHDEVGAFSWQHGEAAPGERSRKRFALGRERRAVGFNEGALLGKAGGDAGL